MTSIDLFMSERAVFSREQRGKYYRVGTYFISKALLDGLLLLTCAIVHLAVGGIARALGCSLRAAGRLHEVGVLLLQRVPNMASGGERPWQ